MIFFQLRMKKAGKLSRRSEKMSQKADNPDGKAADFFCRWKEKCKKKKQKNLSNHPKKYEKYPDEKRKDAYPKGWFILKKWIFY